MGHPELRERARELAKRCREVWFPLVTGADSVALLDIPNHNNPGDAAILLGELELLSSMGRRPAYSADLRSYRESHMRRRLGPAGLVLLHGGGNTGDTYPKHQAFREQFLAATSGPVVQLPQSVYFESHGEARRAGQVYAGHPELIFLARDTVSQARLRDGLSLASTLCPDAAFALVDHPDATAPRSVETDVAFLLRTDTEGSMPGADAVSVGPSRDWDGGQFHRRRYLPRLASRTAPYLPASASALSQVATELNRRLTERLVTYAFSRVSQGRVLVTDRLHGVILATVAGVPHVALDNANGKVHAFHKNWLDGLSTSRRAGTISEALHVASDILGHDVGPAQA